MIDLESINLNLILFLHWMLIEENVTRAGKRVGLSQPAASRALQNLRHIFNDELFIRHGRKSVPTHLAKDIAPKLREAVANMRDAVRTENEFEPSELTDEIVIASNDYLSVIGQDIWQHKVQPLAPSARSNWRPLEPSVIEGLVSGATDLVLAPYQAGPNMPQSAALQDMVVRPFMDDRFVVFGNIENQLLSERLSLQTFTQARHILVSPSGSGPGIIDQHLKQLGYERRIDMRCHSFLLAAQSALSGDAVTVIPQRLAKILNGGAFRDLPFETPALPSFIAWHASRSNDLKHKWVRTQFLKKTTT